MNKIKLYIVKQGESIADIAEKFGINKDEIVRYNPSLKYKNVYKGQPLNILIKDEIIPSAVVPLVRKESVSGTSKKLIADDIKEFYHALKDSLLVKAFYPSGDKPYIDEVNQLIEKLGKYKDEIGSKIISSLNALANHLLDFLNSIINKDVVQIKNDISSLRRDSEEISQEVNKKHNVDQEKEIGNSISLWRDLVIAIAELDFKTVITKFKELLHLLSYFLETSEN